MATKSDVWRAMSERRDGCMEPDATWGVCGITEELHETAFETLRGTRFWHAYRRRAVEAPDAD